MTTRKGNEMTDIKEKPKIKITTDGPYIVSGNVPMSEYEIVVNENNESIGWKKLRDFECPESYALCRCGHTKNKPFCDGTHAVIGFCGTETATEKSYFDEAERIPGKKYDLYSQDSLCVGARFCDVGKKTWHLVSENDKEAEGKQFLQQCADCPSGRFVAWDKENNKAIEPHFEPEIVIVKDPACKFGGPIWVRGGIQIEGADGKLYEVRNRVTLCRCGASENKPFCDASHFDVDSG